MPRLAAALALALLVLSGCVAPGALRPASVAGSLTGLSAEGATKTIDAADGTRTFVYEGASSARMGSAGSRVGFGGAFATGRTEILNKSFDLDNALVGYAELTFVFDPKKDTLLGALYDPQGRLQCRVDLEPLTTCSFPLTGSASSGSKARLVVSAEDVDAAGSPFTANVTLHPLAHLPKNADPAAGTDPAIRFRNVDTKMQYGDEMNVGVLKDGSIYVQGFMQTFRSKDDGATWTDVSPLAQPLGSCDPMMRADPWSGRVYTAQLDCVAYGNSVLSWTTDEGATWLTQPMAGLVPTEDHEKLAIGPSPIPGSPVPVVYYAHTAPGSVVDRGANPSFVERSLDGGATFTAASVTGLADDINVWTIGAVEADRSGDVYLPISVCSPDFFGPSKVGVAVSTDYGMSFRYHEIASSKLACPTTIDPGVGIDTDGVAYLAYIVDGKVQYVVSKDHGASWNPPVTVSLPTQTMASHVDIIAGDPGKIAILYRATSDSIAEPSLAPGFAAWHMYVAFVDSATSATPQTRVSLVTPPEDPVMRGCVWQYGGGNPCRSLYDFIDIGVLPDGRVVVAYPDACPGTCPTPADSRAELGIVGVEQDGPRLFAQKAPWAP